MKQNLEENLEFDPQFDEKGFIPAIAQDVGTGQVLTVAYMNREALDVTIQSGYATYFSRSRQKLWKKGEEYLKMVVDSLGDRFLTTDTVPSETTVT